jgi:hypothetical protein
MPGGLMQLLAWGNQNLYLNGNPSITFFKKVYKTHTNFSMESIRINFNRTDALVSDTTTLKATIARHGDLVSHMYLVFELPDIQFSEDLVFKWIDYIGEAIIANCQISINGNVIDRQTGEFKHLYHQLAYGADKQFMLEKMTAHRYDVPTKKQPYTPYGMVIHQNFSTFIPSRLVYVPLNFWCNKTLAHGIPLIALQYSEVEVSIDIRPIAQLYTLFYVKNGISDFWAPNTNNSAHSLSNFVDNSKKRFMLSDTVLDIKAYLEVNYVFLDTAERKFFAYKPLEYLIEQTTTINRFNVSDATVHDLVLTNPVKEILWVCSRSDNNERNMWFNYTDQDAQILSTAKLMFNGLDRFDEKDAIYFNYVQPFQHHRANYKDGLYVYSFAINADDYDQPSGAANSSVINKVQMYMTTKKPDINTYTFNATFYAISYNLLRIEKGLGSIVFSK